MSCAPRFEPSVMMMDCPAPAPPLALPQQQTLASTAPQTPATAPVPPRRTKRTVDEMSDREKWGCPYGCGKVYRNTSTNSISNHLSTCVKKPALRDFGIIPRDVLDRVARIPYRLQSGYIPPTGVLMMLFGTAKSGVSSISLFAC